MTRKFTALGALGALLCASSALAQPPATTTMSDGVSARTVPIYAVPPVSFVAMTISQTYTPGQGIFANCTSAGSAVLAGADSSTITVPLVAGPNQYGYAIAKVVSSTATCNFTLLR